MICNTIGNRLFKFFAKSCRTVTQLSEHLLSSFLKSLVMNGVDVFVERLFHISKLSFKVIGFFHERAEWSLVASKLLREVLY